MTIKTRKATTLTESQTRSMYRPEDVREVVVNGVIVGQYGKNKHGATIGHFDREAIYGDENPFVASRPSHSVLSAGRASGRTVKDLVADIAAQEVGAVAAYLEASATVAKNVHEFQIDHLTARCTYWALPWRELAAKVAADGLVGY